MWKPDAENISDFEKQSQNYVLEAIYLKVVILILFYGLAFEDLVVQPCLIIVTKYIKELQSSNIDLVQHNNKGILESISLATLLLQKRI